MRSTLKNNQVTDVLSNVTYDDYIVSPISFAFTAASTSFKASIRMIASSHRLDSLRSSSCEERKSKLAENSLKLFLESIVIEKFPCFFSRTIPRFRLIKNFLQCFIPELTGKLVIN